MSVANWVDDRSHFRVIRKDSVKIICLLDHLYTILHYLTALIRQTLQPQVLSFELARRLLKAANARAAGRRERALTTSRLEVARHVGRDVSVRIFQMVFLSLV